MRDKEKYGKLVFQQTVFDSDDEDEDAGNTPLHVACKWNQMDLVEFFYEIGGDQLVKIKNKDGYDSIEFSFGEN